MPQILLTQDSAGIWYVYKDGVLLASYADERLAKDFAESLKKKSDAALTAVTYPKSE